MQLKYNFAWELISHFESFSPVPYMIPGEMHFTIGFGRTGSYIRSKDIATREVEKAWVLNRICQIDKELDTIIPMRLDFNQTAVLISFIYNVGFNAFLKSTLFKCIKTGNLSNVPSELQRWTKGSAGQTMLGLVKRRKIESLVWKDPINLKLIKK
jgi:lysozyme